MIFYLVLILFTFLFGVIVMVEFFPDVAFIEILLIIIISFVVNIGIDLIKDKKNK